MTNPRIKYPRNEASENVTAQRIRKYESKAAVTVKLPAPGEQIVEQVLGLDFDWEVIGGQPGEQLLGGLVLSRGRAAAATLGLPEQVASDRLASERAGGRGTCDGLPPAVQRGRRPEA